MPDHDGPSSLQLEIDPKTDPQKRRRLQRAILGAQASRVMPREEKEWKGENNPNIELIKALLLRNINPLNTNIFIILSMEPGQRPTEAKNLKVIIDDEDTPSKETSYTLQFWNQETGHIIPSKLIQALLKTQDKDIMRTNFDMLMSFPQNLEQKQDEQQAGKDQQIEELRQLVQQNLRVSLRNTANNIYENIQKKMTDISQNIHKQIKKHKLNTGKAIYSLSVQTLSLALSVCGIKIDIDALGQQLIEIPANFIKGVQGAAIERTIHKAEDMAINSQNKILKLLYDLANSGSSEEDINVIAELSIQAQNLIMIMALSVEFNIDGTQIKNIIKGYINNKHDSACEKIEGFAAVVQQIIEIDIDIETSHADKLRTDCAYLDKSGFLDQLHTANAEYSPEEAAAVKAHRKAISPSLRPGSGSDSSNDPTDRESPTGTSSTHQRQAAKRKRPWLAVKGARRGTAEKIFPGAS